ncbi:hypothetical protein EJB05_57071, partial [Eragrostis curvula]
MQPDRHINRRRRRRRGGAADADFVAIGFAAVATAVSFLVVVFVARDDAAAAATATTIEVDTLWQVILAFATMAAGLLFIAYGMRVRDARPPVVVRRAVDAVGAVLWHAGGPERRLLVLILVICPFLEAWFDFF